MLLRDVLAGCRVVRAVGNLGTEVLGIVHDSRQVSSGSIFFAIKGFRADGNRFVSQALARGAAAVVSGSPSASGWEGVPWVEVEDDRLALAVAAANLYGRPTEKLHAIGITGTNGKTTTTYLLESILKAAGFPAALFGTIEYRGPGFAEPAERTTPEASDLELLFKRVVDSGWKYAVMEVSSHAIELKRVSGLHFEVAVFTNLSRDHLDFHGDMRSYFLAKKQLFTGLDGIVPRVMVLNMDDPHFEELKAIAPSHVISYGMRTACDVHPLRYQFGWNGTDAVFSFPGGEVEVHSKLMGQPNLYNMAAAIGAAVGLGVPVEAIRWGIDELPNVSGRFESVDAGQPFRVIVDYAHTDDALENLLRSAREITPGKIILVFGCGGDRDRTKRPLMGQVAGRLSDLAVLTSDNPRTEDPLEIIRDIEAGLQLTGAIRGTRYHVVPDRRTAIRQALTSAEPGDTVLLAGKGHEAYQTIGNQTLPFDDRVVARELLDELELGRSQ